MMNLSDALGLLFASFLSVMLPVCGALSASPIEPVPGEQVTIPGGSFSYPLPGDVQDREIWVSAFRIDAIETTVAAYSKYATASGEAMPGQPEGVGSDHPVVNVTWDEADAFCAWRGASLPTEAQWLRAALGSGEPGEQPWLDAAGERCANVDETDDRDIFEESAPVASFAPNGYGLYDMVGNAAEWVRDGYIADYPQRMPARDPRGPAPPGDYRTLRGFGWYHCTNRIDWAARNYAPPGKRHIGIGFRCVSDPERN